MKWKLNSWFGATALIVILDATWHLSVPEFEFKNTVTVSLSVIGALLFFISIMIEILQKIDKLRDDFNPLIALPIEVVRRELGNRILEYAGKVPSQDYIDWLSGRFRDILRDLDIGKLTAPDPDYFRFAEIILTATQNNVISTSKVAPSWYEQLRVKEYIQNQKNTIVDQNKKFTRIFFIPPNAQEMERKQLRDVIRAQVLANFQIILVESDDLEKEQDVAIIDDGNLVVKAEVESSNGSPLAEIIGCHCYLVQSSTSPEIHRQANSVIEYVRHDLLNRPNRWHFTSGTFTDRDLNQALNLP
jgi:hypothetical protein